MTKLTLATVAALVSLSAVPAFAGDQDTATLLQDSGRYVPQVSTFNGSYASARKIQAPRIAPVSTPDFQLVGHN